jgi:hypothetical protein
MSFRAELSGVEKSVFLIDFSASACSAILRSKRQTRHSKDSRPKNDDPMTDKCDITPISYRSVQGSALMSFGKAANARHHRSDMGASVYMDWLSAPRCNPT